MIIKKVFLAGTYNSTWRDKLIPKLKIKYIDPKVNNKYDELGQYQTLDYKLYDYCLYVITPRMNGFYSISEAINDSNKRGNKIIFCVIKEDDGYEFTQEQIISLKNTSDIIRNNGGIIFNNLDNVVEFLNDHAVLYDYGDIGKLLKDGKKITRLAWKDKNIWLKSIPGYDLRDIIEKSIGPDIIVIDYLICHKNWDNKVIFWNPSDIDKCADDYIIIE